MLLGQVEREGRGWCPLRLTRQVLKIHKQEKLKLYMSQHTLPCAEDSNNSTRAFAFRD